MCSQCQKCWSGILFLVCKISYFIPLSSCFFSSHIHEQWVSNLNYMFKVNDKNSKTRCNNKDTPRSIVSIVNFEQVNTGNGSAKLEKLSCLYVMVKCLLLTCGFESCCNSAVFIDNSDQFWFQFLLFTYYLT